MNGCEEKGISRRERGFVGGEVKSEEGLGDNKEKKAGAFGTGVFLQDTDNGAWAQLCIYTCTYAQSM